MKTIEYKVSFEKMVSRLPALFAYLESDDYGVVSLHKASDSIDGCWGKIVENIKLPSGTSLIVDEKVLLEEEKTYTFRTIIDYYYQYHDLFTKYVYNSDETRIITIEEYRNLDQGKQRLYKRQINSDFIKFVEKGIGKIEIPFDKYHELINNSNLYVNIRKDNNVITKEEYDELSKEEQENYRLKKNENVPKFIYLANVISLYNELVKMGKQCMFYQKNKEKFGNDKHMCCLCERYINIGGDGLRDYVGGLIEVYKEISDEYFNYADNENSMTLDFDIDLTSTYQDYGILTPYVPIWLPYKRYKVGDNVEYNGEIYVCKTENTGKWSDDYLTVVFDDTKFEKIDSGFVDIHTEEQEGKIVYTKNYIEKTINSVGEIWYDGESIKHIAQNRDIGRIVKDYDIKLQFPLQVGGMTDSKLVDLRRFVTYYNDDGIAERTEIGEDWLFYYRKNSVVNIRTLNDDLGNILSYSLPQDENGNKKAAVSKNDLMAYGDVIEDITCDTENHKIKFIYRVGVRLNANEGPITVIDDDGNQLYKWKNFVWDNDTNIGIKYEEEYNYEEGSDLDKLIKGDFTIQMEDDIQSFSFNDYINGKYDKMLPNVKFEFITINNSFDYNKTIANQDVNIVSILTDFEVYRNDFNDFAECELIFKEAYLNGITYKPTKNIDVHIERGSTSVFDKHIAFGEIKTMDDMVTYKNGSFFKMSIG